MTRIIMSGANGRMGHVIRNLVENRDDCSIVAGIDLNDDQSANFPIYSNVNDIQEDADVIIDFSNPALLNNLIEYCKRTNTALVLATTGYSEEQKNIIKEASNSIPVFFTYNMSLGINLLANLAKKAVNILGDEFDIEIIEKHHNQKLDAPSGTALMLADAINEELDNSYEYEYNRQARREKRPKKEIGLHAVRGGTIVGEHEILFAGRDENISLSHSARSREVFAVGALNAALFMNGKNAGLYDMGAIINS